jgi:iron transport multicopper oxidase
MLFITAVPLAALSLVSLARAGTVTYNWQTTWVNAAPDGFTRPVIGINGQWPCPKIEATVGDTVVVNLVNKLGNQTTGLHFHGINQVNTGEMDGPSAFTQCPVPPDSSITYKFVVCEGIPDIFDGMELTCDCARLMRPEPIGVRLHPL